MILGFLLFVVHFGHAETVMFIIIICIKIVFLTFTISDQTFQAQYSFVGMF